MNFGDENCRIVAAVEEIGQSCIGLRGRESVIGNLELNYLVYLVVVGRDIGGRKEEKVTRGYLRKLRRLEIDKIGWIRINTVVDRVTSSSE